MINEYMDIRTSYETVDIMYKVGIVSWSWITSGFCSEKNSPKRVIDGVGQQLVKHFECLQVKSNMAFLEVLSIWVQGGPISPMCREL